MVAKTHLLIAVSDSASCDNRRCYQREFNMANCFLASRLLLCQIIIQAFVLAPSPAQTPESNQGQVEIESGDQSTPTGSTDGLSRLKQLSGRPRIALVLAGGGARGAAHIGVMKVLEREGIKVDFVAGSSVGAVLGSLYSAGVSAVEIERLALSGELGKAFFPKPIWMKALMHLPAYGAQKLIGLKPQIGLYSGDTIRRFVNRHIPQNMRNIEDLKTPFAAIGVNVLDTRPVWITKGDVGTAVQASSTVPIFYRPINIDGKRFIDGGLRVNLPTNTAEAAGANFVVAVRLHSKLDYDNADQFKTVMNLSDRALSIMLAEIEQKAVADADVMIEPDIDDATSFSFAPKQLAKSIRAGEIAAEAAMSKFRAKLAAASQRM